MPDKNNKRYSIGIDLGTQSIKTLVLNVDSKQVCDNQSIQIGINQSDKGVAEQLASDWVDALISVIQAIPEHYRSNTCAIGVSGQQHGLVVLDEHGEVLAPVKLWCDTSCYQECDEIMQGIGGKTACIDAVGNPMMAGYTAPKIKQLKNTYPEIYKAMHTVLLPHDYINFWLTGERCMEAGDASGTGLLNVNTRQWSNTLINAIDNSGHLQQCLPEVRTRNQPIGYVTEKLAKQLSLPKDVAVSIGGGDNMMAAIGTGATSSGRLTLSLGTSGTLFAYSDNVINNAKGELANFCSSNGGWLPLVCTMACTTTTESYRNLISHCVEQIDQALEQSNIGANGLITLAYLNGERVPNLPTAQGMLAGISARNLTPNNLLRSGVEGVTYGLYYGFEELIKHGIKAEQLTITGGGANSPQWCQLSADVFGLETVVLNNNEGAALGAAIQASSLIDNNGVVDASYVDAVLSHFKQRRYTPNADNNSRYQDAYQNYLNLQQHMLPFFAN